MPHRKMKRATEQLNALSRTGFFAFLCLVFVTTTNLATARSVNQIAPDKPQQVEIPFKAEAGDRFRVVEEEEKTRETGGQSKVLLVKRAEYDGKVLAVRDDGYEIQWTLRAVTVDSPSDPSLGAKVRTRLMRETLLAFVDQPYVFLSDWGGRPVRVPNWRSYADKAEASLQTNLPKALKELLGDKAETPLMQNIVAGTVKSLKDLFSGQTETSIAALYEVENIVSSAQNLALPLTVWVDWADSAPVYGNKGEVSTVTNVRLTKFDAEENQAVIEWRTKFDNKQLATAAEAVLRNQFKAMKLPESQAKKLFEMLDNGLDVERTDTGLAKLRTSDGWASQVTYKKRIENKTEAFKSIDLETRTITIERLSP